MQTFVLSSFPRSGNTWVRFVFATALLGRRPSSAELDQMLPDAHKPLAPTDQWITSPGLFLKSHFAPPAFNKYLIALQQALPPELAVSGLRILHIVRNPFDVALSVQRFYEIPDAQRAAFFAAFVDPKKVAPAAFGKWGFGNWRVNTESWVAAAEAGDAPVYIVRYEDLVAKPEEAFASLFQKFGVQPKLPTAECVALCAPDALRKVEENEMASGEPGLFNGFHADKQRTSRFIGGARAGGYRDKLSAAEIELGLAGVGGAMTAAGYDLDAYRPAEMLATA